jgi:hypothetical protein
MSLTVKKYPYETKTKLYIFSQILPDFRFESGYINLSGQFSVSIKFGDRYFFSQKVITVTTTSYSRETVYSRQLFRY